MAQPFNMAALLTLFVISSASAITMPNFTSLFEANVDHGVQIYQCASNGSVYEYLNPKAVLDLNGITVGAGPSWSVYDGSKITLAQWLEIEPNGPGNIDLYKIRVKQAGSENPTGIFPPVETVLQLNTQGGVAPTIVPCTPNEKVEVPYNATYVFYGCDPNAIGNCTALAGAFKVGTYPGLVVFIMVLSLLLMGSSIL